MKRTFTLAALGLLAAAVMAPTAEATRPLAGFAHAYAHPDCAPWDGSAIRIVIRQAPVPAVKPGSLPPAAFPFYGVSLWRGDPPVRRWIAIPGKGDHGMGVGHIGLQTGENQHQPQAGRVWLEELTPTRIDGELRLAPPGGKGAETVIPFSAPRLPYRQFCG